MLPPFPRLSSFIWLLLAWASVSEASVAGVRHAQRYLAAYVQVPPSTPRAASPAQGEPAIAALTADGRVSRKEARQQQQASPVVTKAAVSRDGTFDSNAAPLQPG